MKEQPVIAIDTREQAPYRFAPSEIVTLKTGDYSLVGLEDRVAVERKSKVDAFTSLGRERARFEREVCRLSELEFGAIVVEATLQDLLCPPRFSQMNPRSVVASLLAWSVKYGVPVYFAGDRIHAQATTRCLLTKFWYYASRVPGHV